MKKLGIIALTLVCVVFYTGIGIARSLTPAMEPERPDINVIVDSRLELLAVVQLLSGYGERYNLITQYDFPYKREVIKYFSTYKNQRAVRMFTEMSQADFTYDAPPAAMLYLSELPGLNIHLPFTNYLKTRAGGEKQLKEFVDTLRDFAEQSRFVAFFRSQRDFYQRIVDNAHTAIQDADYVGPLENYYGIKQHSYNIILVPLFVGGFGHRLDRADGTCDIYNICGPISIENELPVFGTADSFRDLAWHEFGHSFVNPGMEKFRNEIAKYSSLFDPIADRMKQQAYGTWETCVNEHLVRAVSTRLIFRYMGKEAAEQALQYNKTKGFFYVEALCKRLEQYENQRDKYRTFTDFFPELIRVFKELSEKNLGNEFYSISFTGTINAVYLDGKSAVLIVPTNESNKAVQDKIHGFVKAIRDKFFKDSTILTDQEALKKNLSGNTIVVYGTPTGNLWLAKYFSQLPVRVSPDRIIAEGIYIGRSLRFISAWPNPQNPRKGMVIYTAQQAEDVIEINAVFHGPTDYVVAKGREVLKAADYNKQNKPWTFKQEL